MRYRPIYHPPEVTILELPASIVLTRHPITSDCVVVPAASPRDDTDDPPSIIQCPRCGAINESEPNEILWCVACQHIFLTDSAGALVDAMSRTCCPFCDADISEHPSTSFQRNGDDHDRSQRRPCKVFCQSCGKAFRARRMVVQSWEWMRPAEKAAEPADEAERKWRSAAK